MDGVNVSFLKKTIEQHYLNNESGGEKAKKFSFKVTNENKWAGVGYRHRISRAKFMGLFLDDAL